jgi:hypothetical protein
MDSFTTIDVPPTTWVNTADTLAVKPESPP